MRCPGCGQRATLGARFCTGCGKPLAAEEPGRAYASFSRRAAAFLLDWLLITLVIGLAAAWAGVRREQVNVRLNPAQFQDLLGWFYLGVLALGWLYWAALESSALQATLGKRVLGMKVTDMLGRRISFARASGRQFGKIVSACFFYLGFLLAAFTRRKQALHDFIAGTIVMLRPKDPFAGTPIPYQDLNPVEPFYK